MVTEILQLPGLEGTPAMDRDTFYYTRTPSNLALNTFMPPRRKHTPADFPQLMNTILGPFFPDGTCTLIYLNKNQISSTRGSF